MVKPEPLPVRYTNLQHRRALTCAITFLATIALLAYLSSI